MVNKEVLSYIKKELDKGFSEKQIKSALSKAGHDIKIVEEALSHLYSKEKKWFEKKGKIFEKDIVKGEKFVFSGKHGMYIVIVLVLIVVVWFGREFVGGEGDAVAGTTVLESDPSATNAEIRPVQKLATETCNASVERYLSDCYSKAQNNGLMSIEKIKNLDECDSFIDPEEKAICKGIILGDPTQCDLEEELIDNPIRCVNIINDVDRFLNGSCSKYSFDSNPCKTSDGLTLDSMEYLYLCQLMRVESESECDTLKEFLVDNCEGCQFG